MLGRLSLIFALLWAAATPCLALTPAQKAALFASQPPVISISFPTTAPRYVEKGTGYASFTAMPGASFSRSGGGFAQTSAGALQWFATGVPRVTDQGLLVESATTNLEPYSQDFTQWASTGSPTVSSPSNSAPDGSSTATLWTRTSTAGSYTDKGVTVAASALPYTNCAFVKQSVGNYFAIRTQGAAGNRADAVVNLSTASFVNGYPSLTGTFTSASGTITAISGGFYRVCLTATSGTDGSIVSFFSFNSNGVRIDQSDSASNSAGYVWQVDLTQSSTAASPVPTTGVSATRGADVCSLTYSPAGSKGSATYAGGSGSISPVSPINLCSGAWVGTYLKTVVVKR